MFRMSRLPGRLARCLSSWRAGRIGLASASALVLLFVGAAPLVGQAPAAASPAERQSPVAQQRAEDQPAAGQPLAAARTVLEPTADERAQLEAALAALRAALLEEDSAKLSRMIDPDPLIEELERQGAIKDAGLLARWRMRRGVVQGLATGLIQQAEVLGLGEWKLQRAEILGDERRFATLVVRHYDDQHTVQDKIAWDFVRRDGAWFLHDCGSLYFGVRLSFILNQLVRQDLDPKRLQAVREYAARIQQALQAAQNEYWWEFDEFIADQPPEELPAAMHALRDVLLASYHFYFDQYPRVLEHCDAAERRQAGIPAVCLLRANALAELGRYESARANAEKYLELMGPDSSGYAALAAILHAMNQSEEAAAAARKGLEDEPSDLDCLLALASMLPAEQKEEVGRWFVKVPNPAERFEEFCEALLEERDIDSLAAVVAAYAKIDAEDPEYHYYDGKVKLARKQFVEAAAAALRAIPGADDEQYRDYYRRLYFEAMVAADRTLEAYRGQPDRVAAFRQLAEYLHLVDNYDQLDKLIAEHRGAEPDDVWIAYYTAVVALDDDSAAAAQMLQSQFSRVTDEDGLDEFHELYLEAAVAAGKILEAYRALPDKQRAFWRLTDWRIEPELLDELIRQHRRVMPDDPYLDFYQAQSYETQKKYDEAVELMKLALGRRPNDDDFDIRHWHQEAYERNMILAGKWRELYTTAEDPAATFGSAAALLYELRQPQPLAELVALHRRDHPDDPWLELHSSQAHVLQNQFDAADDAIVAGIAKSSDESVLESYRLWRQTAQILAGKADVAYAQAADKRQALGQIVDYYHNPTQSLPVEPLRKAVDQFQAEFPKERLTIVPARLLVVFHEGRYADFVRQLVEFEEQDPESAQLAWLRDYQVRANLRLGQRDEALRVYRRHTRERSDLGALVHAALGDAAQARRRLELALREDVKLRDLYADPDLGPLLRSDLLADFRQRHPDPDAAR